MRKHKKNDNGAFSITIGRLKGKQYASSKSSANTEEEVLAMAGSALKSLDVREIVITHAS